MSEDLRARLDGLRDEAKASWEAVDNLRDQLTEARKAYARIDSRAEALAEYIHKLDGYERDCPGHEYIAEPSGRGIGFDERCKHCGYFRTLYPVY